jgi:aspartyl-tRNA(Asn)/glutamyl-tRNA(Gln) amidotransferase subunit C
MEVNEELLEKLANLSRLHFTEEEKKEFGADLQKMIRFMEKLNELDLSGTEPLLHMSDEINVLRDDEIKGSVPLAVALKNAQGTDGVFFRVPKVIKK